MKVSLSLSGKKPTFAKKQRYFTMVLRSFAVLFLIVSGLYAPTNPVHGSDKDRFLHISYPGLRSSAERDLAYSPLLYAGIQGSFSIAYAQIKPNASDLVMLHYAAGQISNKWNSSMQVHAAGIQTYKFYHRQKDPQTGIHYGWSNNNEFNMREVDDLRNFNNRNEYFTSFGPAMRYRLPFGLFNRQFLFEALLHMQLLGFKLQSSYVSSMPPGFEEPSNKGIDAFLKSIDLFYPGNAWNTGLHGTLYYELKSGNKMNISYRYDYLKLDGAHTVEKSRGTWYLGIITAL
jgi:hypothetical protein